MRRRSGRRPAGAVVAAGLVALAVVAGFQPAAAAAPAARRVVVFRDAAAAAAAETRLEQAGIAVAGAGLHGLAFTASEATARALPGATYIGRDHVFRATDVPNDPCYPGCPEGNQSYLDMIGAPAAWSLAKGDGVTIAIVDSGVDFGHPDLAAKNAGSVNFTDQGPEPDVHGTKVAGLAAAATDNGAGVAAVGWHARLLSLKVLGNDGSGFESWVAEAIDTAVSRGAKIINLSLAGPDHSDAVLGAAVRRAVNAGAVLVAAAGNLAQNEIPSDANYTRPQYPASLPGVIAVAATDNSDVASFSRRGSWVDIAAPGASLLTTSLGGTYQTATGTSAASPVVAGTAALLVQQGIDTSADAIARRLNLTGVPVSQGLRRLHAGNALLGGYPFSPGWKGGARVARGNLLPDPGEEIVVAAGPGGGPHIRVFRADGSPVGGGFMAYDPRFDLGVDVAVGNMDGDPYDEIVTGVNPGGGPHVRVFEPDGTPHGGGFMAYDIAFRGGARVAVGDVDPASPGKEIVTAPGPGGGPHVAVFTATGTPLGGFMAYAPDMSAGLQIAAGDVSSGGGDEIVTGVDRGGGPHVKVFRNGGVHVHGGFFAYAPEVSSGIDVAVGDVRAGGLSEIVTTPGPGGGPHVQVFRGDGFNLHGFFALDPSITAGLAIAVSSAGYVVTTLGHPTVMRGAPPTA